MSSVKDNVEKVANQAKKAIKTSIKLALKPILIKVGIIAGIVAILIILLGAGFLYLKHQLEEAASKVFASVDTTTMVNNIYSDQEITDSNIDDYVNQIIDELKKQSVTLEDLGISEKEDYNLDKSTRLKYFLKKYVTASLVTQVINSGKDNPSGVLGGVTLERHDAKTDTKTQLKYSTELSKDTFTIDSSGNIQYQDANGNAVTINKSQYQAKAIPIMFFVSLCLHTESPEFVEAMADYIINNSKNGTPYMKMEIIDSCTDKTIKTIISYPSSIGAGAPKTTSSVQNDESYTSTLLTTEINSLLYNSKQDYQIVTNENETDDTSTDDTTERITEVITHTTTYTYQNNGATQTTYYESTDEDTNQFYKICMAKYKDGSGVLKSGYNYLVDIAELMFDSMDKDSTLSDNINVRILKYILYKWTGKDYGVTDPNKVTYNNANGTAGSLTGNLATIYNYFSAKGLDNIHIAAILGNMYGETGINPCCVEGNVNEGGPWAADGSDFDRIYYDGTKLGTTNSDPGTWRGYGLTQWSGDRTNALQAWADKAGTSWKDINTQLDFEWYELNGGYDGGFSMSTFLATQTIEDATEYYQYHFEGLTPQNSKDATSTLVERKAKANEYFNQMGTYSSQGTSGSSEAASIPLESRMAWLFPNGVPTSESECAPYLTTITVPINDSNGNATTTSITVHKNLAQDMYEIFSEMQATGFMITDADCYGGFRNMASGTGHISHHSYGVAIDINADSNLASYLGSVDTSSPYYNNPAIVQIWKNHGFYWGGDWSPSYYDPMHFTYTNH